MFLNDKYLREFSTFSNNKILDLINLYEQNIKYIIDDENYIDVETNNTHNKLIFVISVKKIHLYKLILNCLNEIDDRNSRRV